MRASVRRYQEHDLEQCRALWGELTDWHRRIYKSPSIGGLDPGLHFDELLQQTGPGRIWVAEVNGRVVGMTGMLLRDGEAELEPIIVTERYRRLGIGRMLAAAVVAAAREAGARQLLTRPVARNDLAVRFFHSLGFSVLGQVELVMDLRPQERQTWRAGERLAGKDFRV